MSEILQIVSLTRARIEGFLLADVVTLARWRWSLACRALITGGGALDW